MRSLKEKKVIQIIITSLVFNMCFIFPVFASSIDFTKTDLFKGTSNLLWAATAALTAITVAVTIFLSIKAGMAWQVADDQEKNQKKKALITTIAIGVIVASLSGLVTLILGAYGLTDGSGGSSGTVSIDEAYQFAKNVYHHRLS